MSKGKRGKQMSLVLAVVAGVIGVGGNTLAADVKTAEPESSQDWPQWRGPNRDGIVLNSPKLLDSWPKDGPPLVGKSDFIPAWRDGGCSAVVVADGKVFVYDNKQPVDGSGKQWRR